MCQILSHILWQNTELYHHPGLQSDMHLIHQRVNDGWVFIMGFIQKLWHMIFGTQAEQTYITLSYLSHYIDRCIDFDAEVEMNLSPVTFSVQNVS